MIVTNPRPTCWRCRKARRTCYCGLLPALVVKTRFVILEDVMVGVCDECGSRFYTAETLKRVQEVATGAVAPQRFDEVPVAHAR